MESFPILPRGHANLPETTRFELSDLDQTMTGNHTIPCLAYSFSGDREVVLRHLQIGLQNVLTCMPIVGGKLLDDFGRIAVVRENHEPVLLHAHHIDRDENISSESFPTYENLAATGFPADFFSGHSVDLTPPGSNLAGFRRDTGCPVSSFQVTFLRGGGLILVAAMHHMVADAHSIAHTLRLWSASSRAATHNKPLPTFAPILDRAYFSYSNAVPLTWKEVQCKKKTIRGFSFHPLAEKVSGEALTEPTMPPPTEISLYRFGGAQVAKLKDICRPEEGFVSSYDVICGLVWRCMTRARISYLEQVLNAGQPLPKNTTTEFAHPVDSRGRFGNDVVPLSYFGNGFSMMVTEPITISDLVSEDTHGLGLAAQRIRAATQMLTRDTIPDLVAVRRGIEGREEMRWIWRPENVVSTSWTAMKAMETFDFGFGLPAALRLPVPPFEGILGVLPGYRYEGDNGQAFDVYVVLEKGCQQRLRTDLEFQQYCTEIGK